MASSSAEASSYAQGFGVTRRRGKQGEGIKGPAFAKATAGKLRSAGGCGLRIAIMPEVETRFSVVADQAAERKRLRPRSREDRGSAFCAGIS